MLAKLLSAPRKPRQLLPRYWCFPTWYTSGSNRVAIDSFNSSNTDGCELHELHYHDEYAHDKEVLAEWFGAENVYNDGDATKTNKYFILNIGKVAFISNDTMVLYWQAGKYANENRSYWPQAGKYRYAVCKVQPELRDAVLAGQTIDDDFVLNFAYGLCDYVDEVGEKYHDYITEFKWGDLPFPRATAGASGFSNNSTIEAGSTAVRKITISAADVEDAKKYAVFESSNPDVVSINDDLTLSINGAGSATITAKWPPMNGKYIPSSSSWTINVKPAAKWTAEGGSLNHAILGDDNVVRYATFNGFTDNELAKANATYSSSKPEVATIDESGNINIVGKGSTTITATVPANTAGYDKELTTTFALNVHSIAGHSNNKTFDDVNAPYFTYDGVWTGADSGFFADERVPEGKMFTSDFLIVPNELSPLYFGALNDAGESKNMCIYSEYNPDGGFENSKGETMDTSDGKRWPLSGNVWCSDYQCMVRFVHILNPNDMKNYFKKYFTKSNAVIWDDHFEPVEKDLKLDFTKVVDNTQYK